MIQYGELSYVLYLFFEIPRHIAPVLLLLPFLLPIPTRDDLTTSHRTTVACHLVILIIGRCPIVGQLLSRFDVVHGDEDNLPLHSDIRLT